MLICHVVSGTFRKVSLWSRLADKNEGLVISRSHLKKAGTELFMDRFQMLDLRNFEWYCLKRKGEESNWPCVSQLQDNFRH